jgi:hypothetical protein
MNANELADLIECACCAYQKEAGAMLRQQQAEIEALKVKAHEWYLIAMEIQTTKPAKYSDEWWKEVDEFNKQLKAQGVLLAHNLHKGKLET